MSAIALPAAPPALDAGSPLAGQPAAGSSRYGVRVGGERLLLGTDGAVRVMEPPPVFRLPNTRRWFLGVANVRGTLVPVHDLAAWLELPAPDAGRMLLVAGDGDASAGMLIDASPRHLQVVASDGGSPVQPLAPGLRRHAGEAFQVAGETWTSMDWPGLFNELRTLALGAA